MAGECHGEARRPQAPRRRERPRTPGRGMHCRGGGVTVPGGLRCVRVRESADRRMQIPGWRGRTQGARLCLGDLEDFVLATERERREV